MPNLGFGLTLKLRVSCPALWWFGSQPSTGMLLNFHRAGNNAHQVPQFQLRIQPLQISMARNDKKSQNHWIERTQFIPKNQETMAFTWFYCNPKRGFFHSFPGQEKALASGRSRNKAFVDAAVEPCIRDSVTWHDLVMVDTFVFLLATCFNGWERNPPYLGRGVEH